MRMYVYVRDIVRDVCALYKRDKMFEEFKFVIVFNFYTITRRFYSSLLY